MQENRIIVFGIGSNLGNRKAFIKLAIDMLRQRLLLNNIKKSSMIENPAMLLPDSPKEWDKDFMNIVICADIDLTKFSPIDILKIIKNIEIDLGREVKHKWAPREIDIDILAIDDMKIDFDEKLTIPHKGLFQRDFFINGFKEIAPELFLKIKIN